jgi:hypothetical protein
MVAICMVDGSCICGRFNIDHPYGASTPDTGAVHPIPTAMVSGGAQQAQTQPGFAAP